MHRYRHRAMAPPPALRRLGRSALALLVLQLAMVGVAGVSAGAAGAKATSTTAPTPKEWDRRIEPIAHEVEKLRKLDFEHPVAVEFLGEAAFEKKVSVDKGKLSAADKRSAERSQSQLRAVGLIGPDVDLLDATSDLQKSRRPRVLLQRHEEHHREGQGHRRRRERGSRRARAHARAAGPALRSHRAAAQGGEDALGHRVAHDHRGRRGAHPERLRRDALQGRPVEVRGRLGPARHRRAHRGERRRCARVAVGAVRGALRPRPAHARSGARRAEGGGDQRALPPPPDERQRVPHALDAARRQHVRDGPDAEAPGRRAAERGARLVRRVRALPGAGVAHRSRARR